MQYSQESPSQLHSNYNFLGFCCHLNIKYPQYSHTLKHWTPRCCWVLFWNIVEPFGAFGTSPRKWACCSTVLQQQGIYCFSHHHLHNSFFSLWIWTYTNVSPVSLWVVASNWGASLVHYLMASSTWKQLKTHKHLWSLWISSLHDQCGSFSLSLWKLI